jgi:integrase
MLRERIAGSSGASHRRSVPDPRNLGHKHIRAMAQVWRREALAAGTIQIYLSMLRTLVGWMGKHSFVQNAAFYGLDAKHSEVATQDHSWSAHGIDATKVIEQVAGFDRHVGAQLAVMLAFGLRRKEAVMLKPYACVVPRDALAAAVPEPRAEQYLRVKAGAKGGRERLIPIDSPERLAALQQARAVATGQEDPLGNPARSLKQNLQRFEYVMRRFELTRRARGVTGHGLRHQHLNDTYERAAGVPSAVRGGVVPGAPGADLAVARLAGHGRRRASTAYLGSSAVMRSKGLKPSEPPMT